MIAAMMWTAALFRIAFAAHWKFINQLDRPDADSIDGIPPAIRGDLEAAASQAMDNPVFYTQMAHARICSIQSKVAKSLSRQGGPQKSTVGTVAEVTEYLPSSPTLPGALPRIRSRWR